LKCKNGVTSELRNSFKKHGKNIKKSIENVNKGSTFAPATTKNVHRNTDRQTDQRRLKFSKKKIQKSL
jgi:hypothetical protein